MVQQRGCGGAPGLADVARPGESYGGTPSSILCDCGRATCQRLHQARQGGGAQLECEIKSGAHILRTLCPHSATVKADDAFHCSQANTSTWEFVGAVQALESDKQPVGVRHVEPNPVIPDEIGRSAAGLRHAAEVNASRDDF